MPAIEIGLILLLVATLTVILASRLKLPVEIVLLVGSLLLSEIPGLPEIVLRPDIVFIIFMPPILFAAAYFTSWRDFKANKRPISLLAIGLVLFTSAAVAWVLKMLVPGMTWPIGFVLGAMVSPPDASAATAITRKLGVPRRLTTILEGESLVNDASALTIYKFAIAAVLTGTFHLAPAFGRFIWVAVGGVAIGGLTAMASIQIYKRIEDTAAQTLLTFLTAFGTYIFGEAAGVSGVIATVTGGLYFGRMIPTVSSAQLRIEAKASWDFVLFVINALVFALIGFQLPIVIKNLSGTPPLTLIWLATIVSVTMIAVRLIWVFPSTYLPRMIFPSIRKNDPYPAWQPVLVLGWTGMRGIVSLAASLALPKTLPDGAPFPYRDLLIFLTYACILVTLLLPALTLPSLLRVLGLKAGDERQREETHARATSIRAVLRAIEGLKEMPGISKDQVEELRTRYERRLQVFEANLNEQAYTPIFLEDQQRRRLMREVLKHERSALVELRNNNSIHNEVFSQVTRELDLEDLRLLTERF